jgi:superfamily II DNA helicase RecQ
MALLGEVKAARKARAKSPQAVTDAGAAEEEPTPERNLYEDNRHPELVEALRAWRLETARALGVPAYHVLHQKTLLGIADAAPATREDMLKVHGFGPRMWEKYGAEILEVMDAARQKG